MAAFIVSLVSRKYYILLAVKAEWQSCCRLSCQPCLLLSGVVYFMSQPMLTKNSRRSLTSRSLSNVLRIFAGNGTVET